MIITDDIRELTADIIEFRHLRDDMDLSDPDMCRIFKLMNKQAEANALRLGEIVVAQLHSQIQGEDDAQGN